MSSPNLCNKLSYINYFFKIIIQSNKGMFKFMYLRIENELSLNYFEYTFETLLYRHPKKIKRRIYDFELFTKMVNHE